jgi:hypothetical protein
MPKTSLYILPGWTEGKTHQKNFLVEAQKHGIVPAASADTADIIMTHSGGCYLVPSSPKAKLIVHIDPSFGLRGKLLMGQFTNILFGSGAQIKDWGLSNFLKIRCWNLFDIFFHPVRNTRIFGLWAADKVLPTPASAIIVVHNRGDISHTKAFAKLCSVNKQSVLVELPGLHEDCWFNPGPYIDLIYKEL